MNGEKIGSYRGEIIHRYWPSYLLWDDNTGNAILVNEQLEDPYFALV